MNYMLSVLMHGRQAKRQMRAAVPNKQPRHCGWQIQKRTAAVAVAVRFVVLQ
jgi:hypothetical protein